jgi:hypothetical protein
MPSIAPLENADLQLLETDFKFFFRVVIEISIGELCF